jgi:transposase-like protein
MKNPPFCPNSCCSNYHAPEGKWFVKSGSFFNRKNGRVQRFQCLTCGTGFSEETFSINYYTKLKIPYRTILQHLVTSSGIRDLSRLLHVSCSTVNNRISRLARQSMAISSKLSKNITLKEDLVADGFESFVKSQYMPNNINILAGKDSQFWFLSDYAQLTRKGHMTEQQKKRNDQIKEQIKTNRITIYQSFQNLIRTAVKLQASSTRESITLYTDEHPQYKRVMDSLSNYEKRALNHICISSKKARTLTNPLFSVNYLDREIRKDNSDHVRETVQFARNTANAMDRLAVYRLYHNFMKSYRINGEKATQLTHGEKAGIPREKIRRELKTLFTRRRFLGKHGMLDLSDRMVWCRCVSTPLNRFANRFSGFVLA